MQYFERAVISYDPKTQHPMMYCCPSWASSVHDAVSTPSAPDANGIQVIGMSSGPEHYPLLSGPHAAPGLNVWIYESDPTARSGLAE